MAARKKAAGAKGEAKTAARPKPAPASEAQTKAPCLTPAQKRKLAKHAMVTSLAVLTATAFAGVHKYKVSRSLHIASGAALLGLALWHHSLYTRKKAEQCPGPL